MGVPLNLVGKKYGRLKVDAMSHVKGSLRHWHCTCKCGEKLVVLGTSLTSEKTKSCGCLQREVTADRNKKHGHAHKGYKTRLYTMWLNMKRRCYVETTNRYERYGGRGIKVHKNWFDFDNFRAWAEVNGYEDGLSIDRIDNDGNYAPGNVQFIPLSDQARSSRRGARYITYQGRTLRMFEWLKKLKVQRHKLYAYLEEYGEEKAIEILLNEGGQHG